MRLKRPDLLCEERCFAFRVRVSRQCMEAGNFPFAMTDLLKDRHLRGGLPRRTSIRRYPNGHGSKRGEVKCGHIGARANGAATCC